MINEAIKKLQSALKQIDEAQPLCPSPGCDILSNAGMNVDLALALLKEQPPDSEFIGNKILAETQVKLVIALKEACDCLDASEARVKELEKVIDERKCQPCIEVKAKEVKND